MYDLSGRGILLWSDPCFHVCIPIHIPCVWVHLYIESSDQEHSRHLWELELVLEERLQPTQTQTSSKIKKAGKKYSFPITLLHLPVKIWFNADTVTELYILTPPLTNSSRARPWTPLRFTGASERTFRITKPMDRDAIRLWITICISICSKRASLLFGFLQ